MCGIAGWSGEWQASSPDEARELLRSMTDTLTHRGPDDQGTEIVNDGGPVQAALGHRRLSIIDLDSGHQPMWSNDRRLVIVYNGELYNFMDLRRDLEGRGHAFSTHTDTEVLRRNW